MSSFYTLLTITNNFPVDLTDGTATIKTGTLVGRIPETIEPEKKTTQIRINATNADDGSSGHLTYAVVIGGRERHISFVFKCDNSSSNQAKINSEWADLFEASVSAFNLGDHPLVVDYKVSAAARRSEHDTAE
ncbi:hypothetical protein LMH87_009325 [Akanthomyces muscarius]|uniref:Uncharacterized protein n=1 Tax=Akanthomyces muscarius TaxID=2231603 RepID=A0A9W8QBX4_AKAMU|nr:hypothetical protein LMH87_009325 [Akanthomyces muscarius]KAJ4152805.1 hypothetical protein LMH87_009325 [Akanthomyces muscarius]